MTAGTPIWAHYDSGGWWPATVEDVEGRDVRVRWNGDWAYDVDVLPQYCVYIKPSRASEEKLPPLRLTQGETVSIDLEGQRQLARVLQHDTRAWKVQLAFEGAGYGPQRHASEQWFDLKLLYRPLMEPHAQAAHVLAPGLAGVSVVPGEPGWQRDALRIFRQAGILVMRGGLGAEECRRLHECCREASVQALQRSPEGNRGPDRFSFGVAAPKGSMLDRREWHELLQCEPLLDVLELIFPEGGELIAGGGDFVLGGCSKYQQLHSDINIKGVLNVQWPPPYVSANFAVHNIDALNGPMRALPGTQALAGAAAREQRSLPSVDEEPTEWLESTLQPLSAGDIIVRDVRVLHGGTPNRSQEIRYLPSLEFASKVLRESGRQDLDMQPIIPRPAYDKLPQRAKDWCGSLVLWT